MKKVFKIIGIVLLVFTALLIAIPFVLESKIDTIVQNYADEHLNAKLSFDDVSLSLISSFPNAEVTIDNLKIVNRAPFENETLITTKSIALELPISALFMGTEEPLTVNEIIANEVLLTLKINNTGAANYDILKQNSQTSPSTTQTSKGFSFDVNNYQINNSALIFADEKEQTVFSLTELNHSGNGIFSGNTTQLKTATNSNISLSIDSTTYLNNNTIKLDALIDIDLENNTYTFKDNKGYINALPLEFEGFLQLVEDGQLMDISFINPKSSFKHFLAIIPETYSKGIEDVETTGDFSCTGRLKGLFSDHTIPSLDISLQSDNASFKYPELPKSVKNIFIDVSIKNKNGNPKETYIDINAFNFKIDEDVFTSEAHLKNLTENIFVNANLKGVLNLANLSKAYPIELEHELSGILKGELNTSFDMDAVATNAFQRIKNNGNISISNVVFSSDEIVNPIQINNAELRFKPGLVDLTRFDAQTGKSDINATGRITNFLGFLLSDKNLQGQFNLTSNTFAVADFISEDKSANNSTKTTSENASLKIPAFLDCTISATAKTVLYDNLSLKNVKGQLTIKDQNASLDKLTSDLFMGQIEISGNVSTVEATPKFDMQLGIKQFDISQSFNDLELLKVLAPIAKVIDGKFNSTIDINGLLDSNFTPNLMTISGNATAGVFSSKVNITESPLLSTLDTKLDFVNFSKLNLKEVKTKLNFENGQVKIQPFTVEYMDIPIEISGSHSFSKAINYDAILQVPVKYLGSDVSSLIKSINDPEVNSISIPVTAHIGGTFANPNVTTDLSKSISKLTTQLMEIKKQKLIQSGSEKATELIGGLLDKNSKNTPKDSTKTDDTIKEGVNSILGGLLGGKKKTKDKTTKDSTKI